MSPNMAFRVHNRNGKVSGFSGLPQALCTRQMSKDCVCLCACICHIQMDLPWQRDRKCSFHLTKSFAWQRGCWMVVNNLLLAPQDAQCARGITCSGSTGAFQRGLYTHKDKGCSQDPVTSHWKFTSWCLLLQLASASWPAIEALGFHGATVTRNTMGPHAARDTAAPCRVELCESSDSRSPCWYHWHTAEKAHCWSPHCHWQSCDVGQVAVVLEGQYS